MRKNLRVAGYARVSTDEQKKYGYSIQAQTEEITQWCNDNGHALQHIYIDEGYSASNMKRPQLQSMLSNLRDLDAIAFTRLDRLSRNVLEANKMLELLQQNDVAMISICEDDINTSTANGLFMFNLKVNLAEHELKKGSERIKAVFEYKIAQGQPITGNVPFGYRIITESGNKRIAIDESKAPIVKDIFESFLLHQSVHHTVEYVNNKYGLSRPYMSYMHILKNEFYAGSYRGNSNYAEPYITKETYNAVQTALQANIRTGIQRHVYLFTGLLRCPECRSKLVGVSHPKGGKRYYYYRCNNAHSVHTCSHKKHYAELATEKYLLSNLDNLLKDHIATISSVTSETKNTTEKELRELRKELDNLNYIFIKKRMPVSTYERLYAETEDKIKRLESFKPQSTDHLNQFLNSGWRSIYDNLTRENKRTLWRNVLDSVHVSPDKIEVFFK